jgi:hypothetical protein
MRDYLVVEVSGCTGPDRPGLAAARRRACLSCTGRTGLPGCAGKKACGPELHRQERVLAEAVYHRFQRERRRKHISACMLVCLK